MEEGFSLDPGRKVKKGDVLARIDPTDLQLDIGTRTVRKKGKLIDLTAVEFDLLAALVQTAGNTVSREDLARDVKRLQAQWEEIQAKAGSGGAPALLSAEPDLVIADALSAGMVREARPRRLRELRLLGSADLATVRKALNRAEPAA
jgi:Ribonuclease G/E